MDLKEELKALIESAMKETGVELKISSKELAAYMSERATHLSNIIDDDGFQQALIAERDSVALRAGLSAVTMSDSVTQRLVGIFQGALAIAAGFLA